MKYDPDSYDMLRAFHLCTRCGEKTDQRPDGEFYALCKSCRDHQQNSKGSQKNALSICWFCANALPDRRKGTGCEWSYSKQPVPGWEADETEIKMMAGKASPSYRVKKCPKYKKR